MTNPTDTFWLRRLIAGLIVALALAASGYLTRTGGTALALTAPPAPGIEELGEPAARPTAPMPMDTEASVPPASSVFGRRITDGVDDTPPSF